MGVTLNDQVLPIGARGRIPGNNDDTQSESASPQLLQTALNMASPIWTPNHGDGKRK